NGAWLESCKDRKVLLPDHRGGRIKDDLERAGLSTTVLPHAQWISISDRVRLWCFADVTQDAVLLVDVDGTLIVNINDATQTGSASRTLSRSARRIATSDPTQFGQTSSWLEMTITPMDSHRAGPNFSRSLCVMTARAIR